jgi:hypothetical protein
MRILSAPKKSPKELTAKILIDRIISLSVHHTNKELPLSKSPKKG